MKATEHYFPVVLFYYTAQGDSNFWVCGLILSVTIQMKATERYFSVGLLYWYKVVLTLEFEDEILSQGVTIKWKLTWTSSYLNILVNALSLSKALPRYFRTLSPARKNSLVPPRIDSVSGNSLMTLNINSNYCPLMICTSKTCLLWETITWLPVGEACPHPTPPLLGWNTSNTANVRLSKKSFVGFHMARDEGLFILDWRQFHRPKRVSTLGPIRIAPKDPSG